MSSIFIGKTGIRSRYYDLGFAAVAGATTPATAILLANFNLGARYLYIDNAMDQDLSLALVHPDMDSSVAANRLFWLEVPTNRVLNFNTADSPSLEFDPGTSLWVYRAGLAPTSGKIRILLWG